MFGTAVPESGGQGGAVVKFIPVGSRDEPIVRMAVKSE
jgi:hypothetical protein